MEGGGVRWKTHYLERIVLETVVLFKLVEPFSSVNRGLYSKGSTLWLFLRHQHEADDINRRSGSWFVLNWIIFFYAFLKSSSSLFLNGRSHLLQLSYTTLNNEANCFFFPPFFLLNSPTHPLSSGATIFSILLKVRMICSTGNCAPS